ncbi:hypothetical protein KJ855_03900 [Patescibacteria group bacterium]|nr:hypothetical protein [Patescibacteria group bacterium]
MKKILIAVFLIILFVILDWLALNHVVFGNSPMFVVEFIFLLICAVATDTIITSILRERELAKK